jgi:hypothetical protein
MPLIASTNSQQPRTLGRASLNERNHPMTTDPNTNWTDTNDTANGVDALQPLRFLTGEWHSDGHGPYGPYALDALAQIRGRWLLLTYEISEPTSHDIFYVSTQVYGHDENGLTLELFDTAGSFTFRGTVLEDGGVRFEWHDGDNWKRSEFRPREADLDFRYESMEPSASDQLSTFEGPWKRGKRATQPHGNAGTR